MKRIHLNAFAMLICAFAIGYACASHRWDALLFSVPALLFNTGLFVFNAETAR